MAPSESNSGPGCYADRLGRYPGIAPRPALALEFRRQPFGLHSHELQYLLNVMRSLPLPGKHFLVVVEPQRLWALARWSTAPPLRPEVDRTTLFTSLADAEWHVFQLRWEMLFGARLSVGDMTSSPT